MRLTKIIFPKTQVRLEDDTLTFVIGNIKMRNKPGIVYYKFYGYNIAGKEIFQFESKKEIIGTTYTSLYAPIPDPENPDAEKPYTFQVDNYTKIDSYVIELYIAGATSENPVYMNHLMLTNNEYLDYHEPLESKKKVDIGFKNSNYVNLYTEHEEYLQVIRPNMDLFTSEVLTHSQKTILVPHLPNESEYDNPSSIVYEYMLMNEQKIRIEK